ncbi:MAG: T9SS type A sorting domain-containing protein [Bacteroidia bacterium]
MHGNPNLLYKELQNGNIIKAPSHKKTSSTSIDLPFFDDFFYASRVNYPDSNLWHDSTVYINTGMGRAPLNIGVATFDGLNKYGYPYDPNLSFTSSQANPADTLTSHEINLFTSGSLTLQPVDSIALIFYYQRTGNGDSPEVQDSLLVDFYKPAQGVWNNAAWALRGNTNPNNNDTVFTRAFVWVSDTAYFHDGFKFRFRNKAATNGNFDNWHIDQVLLDKSRSQISDTSWNDLSIGYVPSPFISQYSSMPFNHYSDLNMGKNYSNFIRYNGATTVNTTYQYSIYDDANALVHSQSFGALNLGPFKTSGWQNDNVHAYPSLDYTFAPMTDSTDYTIKHYMLNLAGDVNIGNDTVYQYMKFRNYFAYDDGSCETGYYILGTGGRMAYRYQLNTTDTLRALRIYFDPVGSISLNESYSFRINVYTDIGSPGSLVYRDSLMQPKYLSAGHNQFVEYKLTSPLVLSQGSWFIGIQQFVAAGITIGYDKNFNSNSNLYYDSGSGWTQSGYYGSLMMRPVFGQKIEPPVSVRESVRESKVFVYPNPAKNEITINAEWDKYKYRIISIEGKEVFKGIATNQAIKVDLSGLNKGVYILELHSNSEIIHKRIIKN